MVLVGDSHCCILIFNKITVIVSLQISSEDFDILVEYLENLAGKARQATIDQAEKMMREADDESSKYLAE